MESKAIEISTDQTPATAGSNSMIFNPAVMEQVNIIAEMMAAGKATVPNHLQKAKGDCFAIVMQAAQWGMNPFAVAQKTHLVNGILGYEAQLVNAVVSSSNAIKGRFHYEYDGDWKHTQKGSTACIRVGAILRKEEEITWGEWLFVGDVTTKNSPLWKTAPKQQAGYLAVKYWARLYCPEVIMGVYSPDEFDDNIEKEINPSRSSSEAITGEVIIKVTLESIVEKITSSQSMSELKDDKLINEMKHLSDNDITTAQKKWTDRKDELKAEFIEAKSETEKKTNYPDAIKACKNADELNVLLGQISEPEQIELTELIDEQFDSFRGPVL